MNQMTPEKRAQVIAALVEGNSIRSTVRTAGIAKNTGAKLLADVGTVCGEFQDRTLRNLTCKRIQCDEIWSFCCAKQKNVTPDKDGGFGFGDVWTWVALDPETKLAISWLVGLRNAEWAKTFMADVAKRLSRRVQLTTDGHNIYLVAVEEAFGADVDYAMLVKLYGAETAGEALYSPPKCIGCNRRKVPGDPDPKGISTSIVERQDLTMRMGMCNFTRLTNAFSKKVENLEHAVALHFMYYNFCRIHQTFRVTPAMAAGVTDRLWDVSDIMRLLEEKEREQPNRPTFRDCSTAWITVAAPPPSDATV